MYMNPSPNRFILQRLLIPERLGLPPKETDVFPSFGTKINDSIGGTYEEKKSIGNFSARCAYCLHGYSNHVGDGGPDRDADVYGIVHWRDIQK